MRPCYTVIELPAGQAGGLLPDSQRVAIANQLGGIHRVVDCHVLGPVTTVVGHDHVVSGKDQSRLHADLQLTLVDLVCADAFSPAISRHEGRRLEVKLATLPPEQLRARYPSVYQMLSRRSR